ncbi:hypothetical protein GRF29_8g1800375 [Pseudopithomyces chartarum]|uniref:DUF924-domain-containing protein n=1 Tax=Pseudopithomyces chartarum TaxID=1892770 RepID=A0AAN6M7H7_9PLEO|nr:hypothetical protein GRF29_8g1800375 [Pseudopithomyces chartarum]
MNLLASRHALPYCLIPRTRIQRSMSTFTLDKSVFNPALYKQIASTWLSDIDTSGEHVPENAAARWFRNNVELDRICNQNFAHALQAIGPEKILTPTAEPFLEEIRSIAQRENENSDESQAAWAALSIVILLDQIPRNVFRTREGLTKVYTHFDTMALEFVQRLYSETSPIPRPDLHPQWHNSFAHRMWFLLPLEHSEDIKQHDRLDDIVKDFSMATERTEGLDATRKLVEGFTQAEATHRDLLEKFGRYPHRNSALGRETTKEEEEFLKGRGATFGVAG